MRTTFHGARPAAGLRLWRVFGILLIAAVLLIPATAARAEHETRDGLYADTHYISVQFMYELEWSAPWEVDRDTVESVEGSYDRFVLHGPDGVLECLLAFGDDLDAVLDAQIEARAELDEDLEVVSREAGVNGAELGMAYVAATLAYEGPGPDGDEARLLEYVEVTATIANDASSATRMLSLVAPAEAMAGVYAEIQSTFVPQAGWFGAVFAGQPRSDGEGAGGAGIDGNAYESPTFGYTLEWEADVWTPGEATSKDGADMLVLTSSRSYLAFIAGADFGGDPGVCVESWADFLSDDERVDDWEPQEDDDGEPVAGEEDGRAWAAFTLTYASDAGDELENVNYVECRTLVEGEAVLVIVHGTSQDAYAIEAEAVAEVLATIELADDPTERDANERNASGRNASERHRDRDKDDRAGADNDGESGVDGETYVSPTWGYTVAWDPEDWALWWTSDEPVTEEGDLGEIVLGPAEAGLIPYPRVDVRGIAGYDGDPEACLAGMVAIEEANGSAPRVPVNGADLPATAPGAVAGLYEISDYDLYVYLECRTLVPGEAVVQIKLLVLADGYNEALPAFEDILANFQLPED